jgi:two-component system sensor histidine kinase TctE
MPDESPPPRNPATPARTRRDLRSLAAALRRPRGEAPPAKSAFVNPLRGPQEQHSLFGEILDWMLAPLLLLWPITVTITYLVAQNIANGPFDRNLADSVEVLSDHVKVYSGEARLMLPLPAREMLRADTTDNVYFMVLGLRGEFVAGDRDLPLPDDIDTPAPGVVKFRDALVRNAEVRIAYSWAEFGGATATTPAAKPVAKTSGKSAGSPGTAQSAAQPAAQPAAELAAAQAVAQPVLIQVAETLEKRSQLANEIIRGVIVPQFVVLPIAVVLVWFGLTRGLAPLNSLQARIRRRRPDDLSPIPISGAPDEVAPLVTAINELLGRFEQNLSTQRRFIADAAHQMKTPLAGLRTQAELAQRETDPQELRRSLRQIAGSTERATHLINQLLALARAEHQSADLAAYQVLDLGALASDVVREWVPQAMARGIDLGYDPPPAPLRLIGVPTLLRELLKNLLDNAIRYSPAQATPCATVTVRVRGSGSAAFLEVEDTGPGIAERERPLVFDRFYRVLGTNVDGSGLGLSIVREIAEQHDALLRISTNPRATEPQWPGTLISVEFTHTLAAAPTVDIGASE